MTPDAVDPLRLEAEVEQLRHLHADTRTLYREVCGLLFFRYGITPTTNKLYQLVRKGSMGTPAQALQQFWQDLRARSRVTIDHPDLPDSLKQVAADAVQTIWRAAGEAVLAELAATRQDIEAQEQVVAAERDAAQMAFADAQAALTALEREREALRAECRQLQEQVAQARGAEAAASTHREALQSELLAAREQAGAARSDFLAELERMREQLEAMEARGEAAVRRAQLELDQERTARRQSDRGLDAARVEVDRLRDMQRQEAVAAAEALGSWQAQAQAAQVRCAALQDAQESGQQQLGAAQEALAEMTRRAERAETERDLSRELLGNWRDGAKVRSGARRKSAA